MKGKLRPSTGGLSLLPVDKYISVPLFFLLKTKQQLFLIQNLKVTEWEKKDHSSTSTVTSPPL